MAGCVPERAASFYRTDNTFACTEHRVPRLCIPYPIHSAETAIPTLRLRFKYGVLTASAGSLIHFPRKKELFTCILCDDRTAFGCPVVPCSKGKMTHNFTFVTDYFANVYCTWQTRTSLPLTEWEGSFLSRQNLLRKHGYFDNYASFMASITFSWFHLLGIWYITNISLS